MKKDIDYPAEITFKSVFTCRNDLHEVITTLLVEQELDARVNHRPSRNSKFISFTITAEFKSDSHLEQVCSCISSIDGFIMMF
jgi:putative lipoic acid-binding regulatory protein